MLNRAACLTLALASVPMAAQDKPTAVFKQLADCLRGGACKNMTASRIHWYDSVNISVLTFKDDGWTYAMRVQSGARSGRPDTVGIFLTPPNERQPTQSVSVDLKGEVVAGELGPQPGGMDADGTVRLPEMAPMDMRKYPGGFEGWQKDHKVYAAAGMFPTGQIVGAEFKPFWQKQADQALAAAARVIVAEQKPSVPFDQVLECVTAANCRNMTSGRMSTWSDAVGFTGMIFEDSGWKYELFLTGPRGRPSDLSIMMTAPGETGPSHLLTLDSTGKLVQAELHVGSDGARAIRRTQEELEARQKARKSFIVEPRWPPGGTLGEEFRSFWQNLADQALDATGRALTR